MVKFNWAISLCLLVNFVGCQPTDSEVDEFPQIIKVSGKPIEKISMVTSGNVGLVVADTFLVIQSGQPEYLQIYSTNSHNLLAQFGKEGKGPGEYLRPDLLKQVGYSNRNNSSIIYVFDYSRQIVNRINILDAINGKSMGTQESITSGSFASFLHYVGDNLQISSPGRGGRFNITNTIASHDTLVPFVPKIGIDIHSSALRSTYLSAVQVNIDKGLIVAAPLHLGELNFFDLEGNLLRSTIFAPRDKFEEELKAGPSQFREIKLYIVDLDIKDQLIYGLNYNLSVVDNNQNSVHPTHTKVQVFDWQGRALREYQLDNRMIKSFAVDANHNRIYGYSPYEDDTHTIISYPME